MVDLVRIQNKIEELETFLKDVVTNAEKIDNSSFGAGAQYGLNCIEKMKKSMIAYQKKPTNKLLKDIFFGFTAITRGVEGFNDYNLEKRFREVSIGIYEMREELQRNIKW